MLRPWNVPRKEMALGVTCTVTWSPKMALVYDAVYELPLSSDSLHKPKEQTLVPFSTALATSLTRHGDGTAEPNMRSL